MIKINEKEGKDSEHLRPDETICYCFGYTRKDIEEDFELHGVSKILEGIRKAGAPVPAIASTRTRRVPDAWRMSAVCWTPIRPVKGEKRSAFETSRFKPETVMHRDDEDGSTWRVSISSARDHGGRFPLHKP